MKRTIVLLLIVFCFVSISFASTVVLESGQRVEGDIIERDEDYIKVSYDGVEVTFYLDEIITIDGIEVEVPEADEYSTVDYDFDDEFEEPEEFVSSHEAPVQEESIGTESYFTEEQADEGSRALSSSIRDETVNVFGSQQGLRMQGGMSLTDRMEQRDLRGGTIPKAALGAVLVLFFIAFLFGLIILAANWKIYTKAGYPGWAVFVPIYNLYIMVKIAGKPGWWMVLIFLPVVSIIILIVINIGIAQNFGKGVGYGLGLAFLPLIFVPMLGFGSAQYQANKVNLFTGNAV